jgi:uncharacterized membrane protein YphA (DoxX/SURF4 family)
METRTHSDAILLAARLCLGAVFIYSGATKLFDWNGTLAEFGGLGLPMVPAAAALTIAVQLVAGLGVALGWQTRAMAMALALFTIAATLVGHRFWTMSGIEFQHQFTTALEHLAIVGGFVLLAALGPGRLSLNVHHHRTRARPAE